ncbi:flotillin family protein [bacterium]|nr:flotillin family protein [bacterium]
MIAALFLVSIKALIYICQPNEVLIFSGKNRNLNGRVLPYRIIKGGRGYRTPFLERVDQIDLTNMIIDLEARNAYTKGGIPISITGIANVKIAGHEPMLNNAIERFLGKGRAEIIAIAKSTLEGSLRGVLATLTPEELNEDRNLFAEKLVAEVEQDMTSLGLVVDTLKIQNITDDVKYLDSIGRTRNAELLSSARIAEAIAHADADVRSAENYERETMAKITAEIAMAEAEAAKLLADAQSRRAAVVAEEQAQVAQMVAKAKAELMVQTARIEQVRRQLEADVIAPAKAEYEAMEQQARANVAPIVEDGKARADALRQLSKSWTEAGDKAREIFILQKIEPVIQQLTDTISDTRIERVTVIDSPNSGSGAGMDPRKLIALNEQVKELFGIDLVDKLGNLGGSKKSESTPAIATSVNFNPVTPETTPPPLQGQ